MQSFVKGRKVDDNVNILLRFQGGARGMLWASQVAPGNENGLQLRIYGEKAGLEWRQDNPNYMWFSELGKPKMLLTRGGAISQPPAASMNVRVPGGHPEGYLEAFATLYSQFAAVIRGEGKAYAGLLPTLADGWKGSSSSPPRSPQARPMGSGRSSARCERACHPLSFVIAATSSTSSRTREHLGSLRMFT